MVMEMMDNLLDASQLEADDEENDMMDCGSELG